VQLLLLLSLPLFERNVARHGHAFGPLILDLAPVVAGGVFRTRTQVRLKRATCLLRTREALFAAVTRGREDFGVANQPPHSTHTCSFCHQITHSFRIDASPQQQCTAPPPIWEECSRFQTTTQRHLCTTTTIHCAANATRWADPAPPPPPPPPPSQVAYIYTHTARILPHVTHARMLPQAERFRVGLVDIYIARAQARQPLWNVYPPVHALRRVRHMSSCTSARDDDEGCRHTLACMVLHHETLDPTETHFKISFLTGSCSGQDSRFAPSKRETVSAVARHTSLHLSHTRASCRVWDICMRPQREHTPTPHNHNCLGQKCLRARCARWCRHKRRKR
jgi:cytochrome c556